MTDSNNNVQGYVLSANPIKKSLFLLAMGITVLPKHWYDPAGSFQSPYPRYKGAARVEGNDNNSLVAYFCDQENFQPAVLKLAGVKLRQVVDGETKTIIPDNGINVCALVRYSVVGYPEIRIITREANEDFKAEFGWNREPVRALGDTPEARYAFVCKTVRETRREGEFRVPLAPEQNVQQAEVWETEDPFA